MKISDHQKHLESFELNFIGQILSQPYNQTIEDLIPQLNNESIKKAEGRDEAANSQPNMMGKNHSDSISKSEKKVREESKEERNLLKMYLFDVRIWFIEVFFAYLLFILLLLVQDKLRFPAFNCLLAVTLSYIIQPYTKNNLIIVVLGIIINIANYYLNISLLTYVELLILYLACYIFLEYYRMTILWMLNILLVVSFGFFALPKIYEEFPTSSSYQFYFVFPFLIYIVKLVLALSHHSIKHYSEPLLQIPLFLRGLQFGVLLSTKTTTVEFWFMIIMITLQIVDERVQFVFKLLKLLIGAKNQKSRWVLTAKCSAHTCINSLHIILLVYFVLTTKLKTVFFSQSLSSFLDNSIWNPLIIWAFFSLYELLSMLKVVKREDKFILGAQFHDKLDIFRRTVCLSLGLWVFYLGMCIPYSMFF